MSDSRAAGAEREEEIEAICENLKAGDTFYVNSAPVGTPSVQPNTEYTLISRTAMGEKKWTLSGDEDYDIQLREKLVAELVRLSKRGARSREEKVPVKAIEEVFGTETEMPKPETKLKPVTEAQLLRLYKVLEEAGTDESPGPLYEEAMDLLLDRELATLGLKLVKSEADL